MRRALVVLTVLAGAWAAAGCGQRLRSNPFDPGNPVTGGRPPGFIALAGDGLVTLRWNPTPSAGLRGYELFRKTATETTYTDISGLIAPDNTTRGDYQLQNGLDHAYRLFYVFDRGLGGLPAEDTATPGVLTPWVADFGVPGAVRLTADGRHVLSRQNLVGPTDVAADRFRDIVWIADTDAGQLDILTPSTGRQIQVSSMTSPGALALDPVDGSAWVCDGPSNAVDHFHTDGSIASPGQLQLISNPLDVGVDPGNSSVWVCERGGDRVRHYAATGMALGAVNVIAPSRVAVDSVTHAAWVTSFTNQKVYRISAVPALSDSFGPFAGPIGISVDARRRRVWVADAAAGVVVALHADGTEEFRVGGLGVPREIALDLASGEAWVTLVSTGEVARLSPSGTVIRRLGGLGAPYGITLGSVP